MLSQVHDLLHWSDYDERDAVEADRDHAGTSGLLQSSEQVVMLEASDLLRSCGLPGAAGFATPVRGRADFPHPGPAQRASPRPCARARL